MAAKIRVLPAQMTDQEKTIIRWLGEGSCRKVDDEGYVPWPVLVERAEDEGWLIYQAWDQLRHRWGAVQMPPQTEQPRWCLSDVGDQYYALLKAQDVAKTEAPTQATLPDPKTNLDGTRKDADAKEPKGAGRSSRAGARAGK